MGNNKYKILLVEDDHAIVNFVQALLETNGYQVIAADRCAQGLLLFSSHMPDLVVLDLGLPDMDGEEFIRQVRNTSLTPIIVLSARTTERDKVTALDLGANPWQALTRVILPQIYPAILSGALIAFSMSFDDFVISFFTAGVGVNNISMYVYSMKRYNPSVNALSTLIVVVVTLILVLANLIPVIKDKRTKKEEQRL